MGVYNDIVLKYENSADFLTIYTSEAHPLDEWGLLNHEKYSRNQHVSIEDRIEAANVFKKEGILGELAVDSLQNDGPKVYASLPERLYVILDGVIVYKGGMGPQMYKPEEVVAWLDKHLVTN